LPAAHSPADNPEAHSPPAREHPREALAAPQGEGRTAARRAIPQRVHPAGRVPPVDPEVRADRRGPRPPARPEVRRSPKVSVVVPVYDPPAAYLEAMIESVRAQTYANWELCLADGASTAAHVRPILERAAAADSRVKVAFLVTNGGIVGNSNA